MRGGCMQVVKIEWGGGSLSPTGSEFSFTGRPGLPVPLVPKCYLIGSGGGSGWQPSITGWICHWFCASCCCAVVVGEVASSTAFCHWVSWSLVSGGQTPFHLPIRVHILIG